MVDAQKVPLLLERLRTQLSEEERKVTLKYLRDAVTHLIGSAAETGITPITEALVQALQRGTPDATRVVCTAVADCMQDGQPPAYVCSQVLLATASAIQHYSKKTSHEAEGLSVARTVNSLLRLLHCLIQHPQSLKLSNFQVTDVVEALVSASNFSSKRVAFTSRSFSAARVVAFNKTSDWRSGPANSHGNQALEKKASNSSLGSAAGGSSGTSNAAIIEDSHAESDTRFGHLASDPANEIPLGRQKRVEDIKRSVRLRIVACVSAWTASAPRLLFAHLFSLVTDPVGLNIRANAASSSILLPLMEDDPSLPVRVDAAGCIGALLSAARSGGYLQVAAERATTTRPYAFTALSGRVAGLIVTVRLSVSRCLLQSLATQKPTRLHSALLDLANVIINRLDDAKLLRKHSEVLMPALTAVAKHGDPRICSKASHLLSALRARTSPAKEGRQGVITPVTNVDQLCADVQDTSKSAQQVECWSLAVAACHGEISIPPHAKRSLFAATTKAIRSHLADVRFGATSFLDAAVKAWQLPDDMLAEASEHARTLALDQDPKIRCLSASIASNVIRRSSRVHLSAKEALRKLCKDDAASVAATSFHALGQAIQSAVNCEPPALHTFQAFVDILKENIQCLGPMLVEQKVQATWAMATLCDAAANQFSDSAPFAPASWLQVATDLMADIESVHTNAVRAAGAILALAGHQLEKAPSIEAIRGISASMSDRTPKAQWNAAYALERAFGNQVLINALSPEPVLEQAAAALAGELSSINFKVATACAKALSRLLQVGTLDRDHLSLLRCRAIEARERLEGGSTTNASNDRQLVISAAQQAIDALCTQLTS